MKTRINTLTIVLSSLLLNSINLSAEAYEAWNNSFKETSYVPFASASSGSLGFSYQSDMYYMQEVNSFSTFPGFAGSDFLTLNSGLFRGMGGDEGMDPGTGTSGNDHQHYANDVPVGDGLLPLLLVILGWIVIVITSPFTLFARRGSLQGAEKE